MLSAAFLSVLYQRHATYPLACCAVYIDMCVCMWDAAPKTTQVTGYQMLNNQSPCCEGTKHACRREWSEEKEKHGGNASG